MGQHRTRRLRRRHRLDDLRRLVDHGREAGRELLAGHAAVRFELLVPRADVLGAAETVHHPLAEVALEVQGEVADAVASRHGTPPQLGLVQAFQAGADLRQVVVAETGDGLAEEGEKSCSGLKQKVFRECLASAGQLRFMPIMMTTLTTVGGLLSLMLAGGPLFKGMATVIVFGLSIGTAFTLFFVPAIYAVFVENFGMTVKVDEADGS